MSSHDETTKARAYIERTKAFRREKIIAVTAVFSLIILGVSLIWLLFTETVNALGGQATVPPVVITEMVEDVPLSFEPALLTEADYGYSYGEFPPPETLELVEEVQTHTFVITYYCACQKCNGKWAGYPTASGTELTEHRTVAVDPEIIPLGTVVHIDGVPYIAEDTGSSIKGYKIDIYVSGHSVALEKGVHEAAVWW